MNNKCHMARIWHGHRLFSPIARCTVRFRRPVLHVQVGNRREKTFGREAGVLRAWNGALETVWRGGVITTDWARTLSPLDPPTAALLPSDDAPPT